MTLLQHMLDFISESKPDLIILTGDYARHATDDAVLPRTWDEIVEASNKVVTSIQSVTKSPLMFSIGNNDVSSVPNIVSIYIKKYLSRISTVTSDLDCIGITVHRIHYTPQL